MAKRSYVFALGAGIGLLILFIIGMIKGRQDWSFSGRRPIFLPLTCGAIALAVAERKRKVKSKEELDRPLTLFGDIRR